MNAYLCKFCGKDISSSRQSQIAMDMDAYSCASCNSHYIICIFFGDIVHYCLRCQINGVSYELFFDISNKKFEIKKGGQTVMELDFLPDITPINVKDKLPTLITFS